MFPFWEEPVLWYFAERVSAFLYEPGVHVIKLRTKIKSNKIIAVGKVHSLIVHSFRRSLGQTNSFQ